MSDNKTPPAGKPSPTSPAVTPGMSGTTPSAGSPSTATSASGNRSSHTSDGKSASQMAKETKDAVSDEAASLSAKAKSEASNLVDKAHDVADSKLDEVKSNATSRMEETAKHIRAAGHEFGDDSYQAQAADYLASNLTRAADMVRNQSLGSLTEDVSEFARRNPALFLGGAALLGFAAARLMKASERDVSPYGGSRSYGETRFDAPPAGVSHTAYDRPMGAGGTGGIR